MHDPHILILGTTAQTQRLGRASDTVMPHTSRETERMARAAAATGAPVTVVLGRGYRVALPPGRARMVFADHGIGLFVGLQALPLFAPVMVIGVNARDIAADAMRKMLAAWRVTPDLILRATDHDGNPGYPICVPVWARMGIGDEDLPNLPARLSGRIRQFTLPAFTQPATAARPSFRRPHPTAIPTSAPLPRAI